MSQAAFCPECHEIVFIASLHVCGQIDDVLTEVLITLEDDEPEMWACPLCWHEMPPADWTANVFNVPRAEVAADLVQETQRELF